MEFTQSLQDSLFIASIFISALFIICTVSLSLRNYEAKQQTKKLKKWRKFSEIEKAQKHEEYDRLASELAEERAFNETQGSMYVRLLLKFSGLKESFDKLTSELKIAQTCLKVAETEITELKSKLSRKNLKRDEKGRVLPKQVRDWTTATKEELLAEAKRRYPVGTNYKGLRDGDITSSNHNPEIAESDIFNSECVHVGWDWVYANGQWAEIIPNA